MSSQKNNTKLLAGVGVYAALAIVVSFATSFIKIGYLSLDAGDIVIVLASFIYGPVAGVAISLVSSLVSMMYSGTMFWGMLMDFFSSAIFSFTASFIYTRKKSFGTAIAGIYISVIATSALMMPLNLLITPLYMPVSVDFVLKEIPRILLPFNFFKALFNGGAALLLYKPLIRAMRKAGLVSLPAPRSDAAHGAPTHRHTVLSIVIGTLSVILAAAALVFLAYANK